MTTTTPKPAVGVGTEFRSPWMDSNPLWRVTRKVRAGVFECIGVNEPIEIGGVEYDSDAAGVRQLFTVEAITAVLVQVAAYQRAKAEDEAWWAEQAPGTVLHYCDGFGKFVRGEVVVDDEGPKLLPVALVGRWEPFDLWRASEPLGPRDRPTHHVERILTGNAWRPGSSSVYESPRCASVYQRNGDPATMDPVDLSRPVS